MPNETTLPALIATGEKWVGSGVHSFNAMIRELILEADNVVMTVYIVTSQKILGYIKKVLSKGVNVEIYIYDNPSNNQFIISEIEQLQSQFSYLKVNTVRNNTLHAKVIVTDNKYVLIGSANATISGMFTNYELGLFIENAEIAQKVCILLRELRENE